MINELYINLLIINSSIYWNQWRLVNNVVKIIIELIIYNKFNVFIIESFV